MWGERKRNIMGFVWSAKEGREGGSFFPLGLCEKVPLESHYLQRKKRFLFPLLPLFPASTTQCTGKQNAEGGSGEIEFVPVQFGKLYSGAQSLLLRCNSLRERRGSFAKTSFADPIGLPPFVASLQKEFFIRRRAASPPFPWTARLVTNARRFTKGVSLSIPLSAAVALPHPIYLPSDPPPFLR